MPCSNACRGCGTHKETVHVLVPAISSHLHLLMTPGVCSASLTTLFSSRSSARLWNSHSHASKSRWMQPLVQPQAAQPRLAGCCFIVLLVPLSWPHALQPVQCLRASRSGLEPAAMAASSFCSTVSSFCIEHNRMNKPLQQQLIVPCSLMPFFMLASMHTASLGGRLRWYSEFCESGGRTGQCVPPPQLGLSSPTSHSFSRCLTAASASTSPTFSTPVRS